MAKFLDYTGLSYLWGKITAALNAKANVADLSDVATSGSYSDLSNVPTEGFNMQFDSNGSINAINRPIQLNGVQKQGAATHSAVNFIPGSNVQITSVMNSSATAADWTFSATDTKPHDMVTDSTPAAINVDSSTSWKIITSFTALDRDALYLISVALQWQSNATGFRSIGISNSVSSADPIGIIFQNTVAAANGAATNMTMTAFLTPTNGELSLVGRQNSGSSKTCSYRYRFIKLT